MVVVSSSLMLASHREIYHDKNSISYKVLIVTLLGSSLGQCISDNIFAIDHNA